MINLSENLLIDFAKSMKPEETPSEVTVFGTVKSVDEVEGTAIVNLDGSDVETRATLATLANPGDRVTVLLKSHKAIVGSNFTSKTGEPPGYSALVTSVTNHIQNQEIHTTMDEVIEELDLQRITNTEIEEMLT